MHGYVRALKRKKDAVNFTTASATLSAAAKIYSCRVDATYNETYRVLGTLTEVKEEELTQNNGGGDQNKKTSRHHRWTVSPRDEWERRYCEPRSIFAPEELLFDLHQFVAKHRQICKTLSKRNHAKIRYKEGDQLQTSDPLFHKMSTLFDTQGAKVCSLSISGL